MAIIASKLIRTYWR